MCQMTVELERRGERERIMESVIRLEVIDEGIRLSTLFEEPRVLPGVRVKTIDFLGGLTTLTEVDRSVAAAKP